MTTSQEMHMHVCQTNAMEDKIGAQVLANFGGRLQGIMISDESDPKIDKQRIVDAFADSIKYVRSHTV